MRVWLYYLFAFFALFVYGGQVCPFIERLSYLQLALPLAGFLTLSLALRPPLLKRLVGSHPPLERPTRQFFLDFFLFVAAGAGITLFNMAWFGFPIGSGLKVIVGAATIGLFAGLDLSLERERQIMDHLAQAGRPIGPADRRTSLIRRFAWFAAALLVLLAIEIVLLIFKDLDWMVRMGRDGLEQAQREIMLELVFVVSLLCLLTLNLIASYARNLTRLFRNQTSVLEQVSRGELDRYVPVASRDEFGIIASHTNLMIDGLRERNRIRSLFGKIVSPEIAQRLLAEGEEGLRPGGSRRDVVVLFSDIRGFTAWTEATPPEEVVQALNRYFADMVDIVHAHGGVVDKFIGDGLMAVFGLADPVGAADEAVEAAIAMLERVHGNGGGFPFHIGIGIHRGEVIAGLIGSPERLEYTFIGDAVNTAARIESLTKALDAPLLVSGAVLDALSGPAAAQPWRRYGLQPLHGKQEMLEMFGLPRVTLPAGERAATTTAAPASVS